MKAERAFYSRKDGGRQEAGRGKGEGRVDSPKGEGKARVWGKREGGSGARGRGNCSQDQDQDQDQEKPGTGAGNARARDQEKSRGKGPRGGKEGGAWKKGKGVEGSGNSIQIQGGLWELYSGRSLEKGKSQSQAQSQAHPEPFLVKHKPLPQDSCHFTHPKIFTLAISKPMRLLSSGRRLNAEIKRHRSCPDSRHKVQNSLSAA